MIRTCVLCGQQKKLFTHLRKVRRHFFQDSGKWVRCPMAGVLVKDYLKFAEKLDIPQS
jgi:hypothetical protein